MEDGQVSNYKRKKANSYIITCYKPHKDNKVGKNICYHSSNGDSCKRRISRTPNFVQLLLSDLTKEIKKWTSDESELILMWDAIMSQYLLIITHFYNSCLKPHCFLYTKKYTGMLYQYIEN